MPTPISGNRNLSLPKFDAAITERFEQLMRRIGGGDSAKVMNALMDKDIGALQSLATDPRASSAMKELVDLLVAEPPITSPRSNESRDIGSVLSEFTRGASQFNKDDLAAANHPLRALFIRFREMSVSPNGQTLTLVPRDKPRDDGFMLESALESMSVNTDNNDFEYSLQGRYSIKWSHFKQGSMRDIVNGSGHKNPAQALKDLERQGVNLDHPTSALAVETDNPDDPVIFLAAVPRSRGDTEVKMAMCCSSVAVTTLDPTTGQFTGGGGFALEKPVVYFYPEQRTSLEVTVEVAGKFSAQYPKANFNLGETTEKKAQWMLIAEPSGDLLDPVKERGFGYLFWEADPDTPFTINLEQAHCFKGEESEAFLEKVSDAYALNDRERTDFISYWIGRLERHPHCLVQVLDEDTYASYAKMTVTPTPDTTIRLFMVIQGMAESREVGAPDLGQKTRAGFTVVEWGGGELS